MYFIYFETLMFGAYMFMVIISFVQLTLLSLHNILVFCNSFDLKPVLPDISIATPGSFGYYLHRISFSFSHFQTMCVPRSKVSICIIGFCFLTILPTYIVFE